jgi:hypothetical protein
VLDGDLSSGRVWSAVARDTEIFQETHPHDAKGGKDL